MARITYVKKAQASKFKRVCEACHEEIVPGQPYKWTAPGGIGARKRFRHSTPECNTGWTRAQMSSSKMGTAWDAQDAAYAALDAIDASDYIGEEDGKATFNGDSLVSDVEAILQDCASGAEECAADYQDGIDALPEPLQYGPTAEESQEKIDHLESWGSDLESWSPSNSDFDPDDVDPSEPGEDPDDDAVRDAFDDWVQEVLSDARDVVDQLEY